MNNSGKRVALYFLYRASIWALEEVLPSIGVSKENIVMVKVLDGNVDMDVDFGVMVFDQDFKDYDMDYFTDGFSDWRKEMALSRVSDEIQRFHEMFPKAKIVLVDTTSLSTDDFLEELGGGADEKCLTFLRAQLSREQEVWEAIRANFFRTDFVVPHIFGLSGSNHDRIASEIADLVKSNG